MGLGWGRKGKAEEFEAERECGRRKKMDDKLKVKAKISRKARLNAVRTFS